MGMILAMLLGLLPLWTSSAEENGASEGALASSPVPAPWAVTGTAAESDDKVWGVEKQRAAAPAQAGEKAAQKKKQVVVTVKNVKDRQYLCLDQRCLVLIGMNSENGERYALFMPVDPPKKRAGDYTREEKIVKFKEGDMIESSVSVKTLQLHELVLHAADRNQTYRMELFSTDIEKYRIGGDAQVPPKGLPK